MLFCNVAFANSIWVGETVQCDATSAVMGLTSDVSWSVSGGALTLSGSGFYRNVTAVQYFFGTAYVTCTWKYRLYSTDKLREQSKTWSFTCYDNPVSISPSEKSMYVGQSFRIGTSLNYSNSYSSSARYNFSSSNPLVAIVDYEGTVTAVGPGMAYINVTSTVSSNSPYCLISVEQVDPVSISLSPNPLRVTIGFSKQMTATMAPDNSSSKLTWSVEDNSIASVSSSGLVTGLSKGSTKVTAETLNGLKATSTVEVCPPPTAVSLPQKTTVKVGYGIKLAPELTPEYSETVYSWSSSDKTIVTVDDSGKIKGVKEGQANVTVSTSNGLSVSTIVFVMPVESALSVSKVNSKVNAIKKFANEIISKTK